MGYWPQIVKAIVHLPIHTSSVVTVDATELAEQDSFMIKSLT